MAYFDAVTRLGLGGGPRTTYVGFSAAAATAAITGISGLTEAELVAGGQTVIITLTNDTWVASGATFNTQRQAIIDGLDAALSPALGWNTEVRDKEVVGSVVRTSDTVVTITLTASPLYDISVAETITVTIPAAALVTSTSAVVATPTFGVVVVSDVEDPPSGGWANLNYYDAYLQRKRRREKERKEIAAEIVQIEDSTDREIAKLMLSDRIHDERDEEIAALEVLVRQQDVNRERIRLAETSEAVARAFTRAYMQGNFSAFEAFEREMEKAIEEQEFLLLALVLLE